MNAVASRVKHQDSAVSEAELLRRLDPTTPCVTNGRLAPGIQMDVRGLQHTDNRISSPAVEAVAICQFDRSSNTLGTLGRSDYNAFICPTSCPLVPPCLATWTELPANRSQVSA